MSDNVPAYFGLVPQDKDDEFELDLDSDEELDSVCDLSDDGTCESCQ